MTNELVTNELVTNELVTNELETNTSDDDSTQKFCRNGTLHLPCCTHCRNLTALRFIRQWSSGKIAESQITNRNESQMRTKRSTRAAVVRVLKWMRYPPAARLTQPFVATGDELFRSRT